MAAPKVEIKVVVVGAKEAERAFSNLRKGSSSAFEDILKAAGVLKLVKVGFDLVRGAIDTVISTLKMAARIFIDFTKQSINEALLFEDSMANVRKTVGLT